MNNRAVSQQPGWYYRLSSFFKQKFGEPVYKIPIDAGFSCPNRDGTTGRNGCIYCYNPSFAPFGGNSAAISISDQIQRGRKKNKQAHYLAYFQSYTNTYAPLERLKTLYDEALSASDIVGLSIATRPDCISEEILDLLGKYAHRYHIWVEYGLQSVHDHTLKKINRGHDSASFARAVKLTHNRSIYICAHVILGLPGETPAMMLETIDFLNRLGIDGIKFHHLQVIINTELAVQYAQGEVAVYEEAAEYIAVLCDCLERLSPDIVIHRLASRATSEELLLAPHWPEGPGQIASLTGEELKKRGTHQGFFFK